MTAPECDAPLLIAIVGPTGAGKSNLAVCIAERCGGEIVSCDSVAVYRGFDIGSAKPSPEERRRAPHHLIDIVDPTEYMTAGEYARRARRVFQEISERGHMPIVAGGTGLYLRATLDGLFPGPERSEELRERLREGASRRGSNYLHRMLKRMDPAAAANIHPNDAPKLIRAIEVCLSARKPMTEAWEQGRDPLTGFRILRIGLDPDRQELYKRINRRAAQMFEVGLVEETRGLLQKCGYVSRDRTGRGPGPLESLGYRQATQFLNGELSREQAIEAAQQGHRNYAKRQLTWFRRETDVHWLHGFGDDPGIVRSALELAITSR